MTATDSATVWAAIIAATGGIVAAWVVRSFDAGRLRRIERLIDIQSKLEKGTRARTQIDEVVNIYVSDLRFRTPDEKQVRRQKWTLPLAVLAFAAFVVNTVLLPTWAQNEPESLLALVIDAGALLLLFVAMLVYFTEEFALFVSARRARKRQRLEGANQDVQ